jgi:hypothetical protein
MRGNDEPVTAPTLRGAIVILGNQRRDRSRQLGCERRALRGRAKPDLGVDRQRRQPLASLRARSQSSPTSRTTRAASETFLSIDLT